MSDASSPQVRDHETREGRVRAEPRGDEMADGARRRYRLANERERDEPGLARRGMAGGKGPSRGGRRSNEPTSHGVVPTRAPSRFFLLFSRCLPRVPRSLAFSLFLPPRRRRSRPSRAYIIHISTLIFFDYVVRRSTFSPIFPVPVTIRRARNRPRCLAKLFDGVVASPTDSCRFGIGEPGRFFCRALL